MHLPMKGVRVLEVAQWTYVPAAGAVLADWGADVIKIEHPVTGDAQRGILQTGTVKMSGTDVNPFMEHPNRGKRSVGLDLRKAEGRELLYEMARNSDVFLTNFLPEARTKLAIDVDDIRAQNPDIIYVRGSALGQRGPEAAKGGYDMTGFWCRAGSASGVTPPLLPGVLGQPAPAYGDSIGGMTIAGGIAGALFARERTGETSIVDVSLLSTGIWAMGMAVDLSLQNGEPWYTNEAGKAGAVSNPLVGIYKTKDGRFISLVMLQPFEFWPDFCRHVEHPEWIEDERFDSVEKLMGNAGEARELVDAVFETRTLSEWSETFKTLAGQWAPVQNTVELGDDPQVRANGYVVDIDKGDGSSFPIVTSPVQFDETPPELRRAPEHAQDTEAVLLEMGLEWERIAALKEAGAVS
ncbi:MAG: CoA transferase [Myxococcota bacterium]|nr:CoA transferase [Myxococcota bacterium]